MTIETKYNIGDKVWFNSLGHHIKATIGRTLRLALQHPDLAQEYLDSLPKATMD